MYQKFSKIPVYEKFKPKAGETESGRYKYNKTNLDEHVIKFSKRSIQSETESDDLEGQWVKIIIPSNLIDIYTILEVLLGLKISEQSNILTEDSNLLDELYKKGENQNEQQYRNALDKFSTQ